MRAAIALYNLLNNRHVTETGCWEWTGRAFHTQGYGMLARKGVHRWSAELFMGETLTAQTHVCHHCDNRKCFNPAHLFVGTHKDNIEDRIAKGREARGSAHGRVKLTSDQVLRLIEIWNAGATMRECCETFGVSHSAVQSIINRWTWAWLTKDLEIRPAFLRGYVRR